MARRAAGVVIVVAAAWLASSSARADLVAHWKFDEGSGTTVVNSGTVGTDANGTCNDSNPGNGVTLPTWITAAGQLPSVPSGTTAAIDFDDNDGYVQIDNWKGIGGSDPRTMAFWLRTTDTTNHGILAWGVNSGGQKWHTRLNHDGGNGLVGGIRTEVNGGYHIGDTDLADGQWHHVAVVFGGNNVNDVMFMVDGQIEGESGVQGNGVNTDSATTNVMIGRRVNSGNGNFLDGDLDDVRVYDAALKPSEVVAIYQGAPQKRAVIEWNANTDTDGTPWQDEVAIKGNTFDLTLGSGVTHQTGVSALPGIQGAYDFDGTANATADTGKHVEGDAYIDPTTASASFEMWIKPRDVSGQEILCDFGGATDGLSLSLNGDQLQFTARDNALNGGVAFDLDANNDGRLDYSDFIQVVGVVEVVPGNDDKLWLYVQGELTNPGGADLGDNFGDWAGSGGGTGLGARKGDAGGHNGFFGNLNNYGSFDGQIALVRFYDEALSPEDVRSAFQAVSPQEIPEPATMTLALLSLAGIGLAARRRRRGA